MISFLPIRSLLDRLRRLSSSKRTEDAEPMRQTAAAVFRGNDENRELLLITSRDTGRWIIPKGWIEDGEDGGQAALREAWEEAGVTGELMKDAPIGSYRYIKLRPRRGDRLCDVDIYMIRLNDEKDQWPEQNQRKREWLPVQQAAERLDDSGLGDLILTAMTGHKAA